MWGCGGNVFWAFQLLVSHFAFLMTPHAARIWPASVKEPCLTFNKDHIFTFKSLNLVSYCTNWNNHSKPLVLLCDCYLQDETEFRDKLSPININFNYSLDESSFEDSLTVKPILNYYQKNSLAEQVWVLHVTFSVYKHESIYKYYVCHLP